MTHIRIATPDLVVKPLLPLLDMLGRSNPVSKGTAYMQVVASIQHEFVLSL